MFRASLNSFAAFVSGPDKKGIAEAHPERVFDPAKVRDLG